MPKDLIYYLTFYHCYSAKCRVLFAEDDKNAKDQYIKKLEDIKRKASKEVQELMKETVEEEYIPKSETVRMLGNRVTRSINFEETIFLNPTSGTILAAINKENKEDFEKYFEYKLKKTYSIECLNPLDPNLTDEMEKEIFKKQLSKYV